MGDTPRPYEPTERHLRRLTERGAGPHSSVARAAVLAAGLVIGCWVAAAWGERAFAGLLAEACGRTAGAEDAALAWTSGLGRTGLGLAAALALGLAVLAWGADGVWAGFGWGRQALARRGLGGAGRLVGWWWSVALLVAAAAGVALVGRWVVAGAVQGDGLPETVRCVAGRTLIGALAMAALLGVADALVTLARFRSESRMSRAEFLEDQRESRGPWLTAWRRRQRLRGGRRP